MLKKSVKVVAVAAAALIAMTGVGVASASSATPKAPCAAGQSAFPDVPDASEFCKDIKWMADQGLAYGYSDGDYRPAAPMSRQAMAAFIHRFAQNLPAGSQGPAGPAGPAGASGPAGADGADGVSGAYTQKAVADIAYIDAGKTGTAVSNCTTGKSAIGGGYKVTSGSDFVVINNQPGGAYEGGMFTGWEVKVKNNGSSQIAVQVAVVCASMN